MRAILAITTVQRFKFLKKTIESWYDTRNKNLSWTIVVADDGSLDGSIEYVRSAFAGLKLHMVFGKYRGIHAQVNRIIRLARQLDYDVAFKIDDDLIFKESGWDDAYLNAIMHTGMDHLVFHDPTWSRKVRKHRKKKYDESGLLQNQAHWDDTQGAFWTFTPRVLNAVGYFDIMRFGLCGYGHRDYTFRCCKAGFNCRDFVYDIRNSEKFLELNQHEYRCANRYWSLWNEPSVIENKYVYFEDDRIYVPYYLPNYGADKNPLHKEYL